MSMISPVQSSPVIREGNPRGTRSLFMFIQTSLSNILLPRDAMQARPMPSCGVCLSACHAEDSVEMNKYIFNFFSSSDNHTILVFPYHTSWQYSDGNPLTGASNAGGVGKYRDLSQYLAPSRDVNDLTAKCNTLSCDRP